MSEQPPTGPLPDDQYVLKTYRYLRFAMIALVVMLGTSVLIEIWAAGGHCYRTSISSYYWTPVRGVFVGGLVAVGVCLIALKGNTPREDVLLNIAGMLAPVVAFVPIQDPHECQSVPNAVGDAHANISNNIGALLVTGVLAMALVIWLARKAGAQGHRDPNTGFGIAVVLVVAVIGVGAFFFARSTFDRWAHYAAAIPLFVILIAVMVINALSYRRTKAMQGQQTSAENRRNPYFGLAVLLGVSVLAMLAYRFAFGWDHATLWVEIAVIVLFAAFWVVQTIELWEEPTGLRPDPHVVGAAGPTPMRSG